MVIALVISIMLSVLPVPKLSKNLLRSHIHHQIVLFLLQFGTRWVVTLVLVDLRMQFHNVSHLVLVLLLLEIMVHLLFDSVLNFIHLPFRLNIFIQLFAIQYIILIVHLHQETFEFSVVTILILKQVNHFFLANFNTMPSLAINLLYRRFLSILSLIILSTSFHSKSYQIMDIPIIPASIVSEFTVIHTLHHHQHNIIFIFNLIFIRFFYSSSSCTIPKISSTSLLLSPFVRFFFVDGAYKHCIIINMVWYTV
mmetsp:Transcript_3792/g.5766  ORF Transcript_3792/g.5766 Transcript_3792/m.5766 type:complete len:253 (+) Transcript_3792:1904-2662(+)